MIPTDTLKVLENDLSLEESLKELINGFTNIQFGEECEIEKIFLDLTSRYTHNIDFAIWFNPKIGYDSIGKVDFQGNSYIDFGTFHSRGEAEAFIIDHEERRWHPVIAIQSFVKRSDELRMCLMALINAFLKINMRIISQAFYVGGV